MKGAEMAQGLGPGNFALGRVDKLPRMRNWQRLELAYSELVALVESGVEYPDAEWRVSESFGLSSRDVERIRAEYDQNQ